MPWEQSSPMDQKTQFVSEYLRDTISFTELCDRSRKTYHSPKLYPACIFNHFLRPPAARSDDATLRLRRSQSPVRTPVVASLSAPAHPYTKINVFWNHGSKRCNFSKFDVDGFRRERLHGPDTRAGLSRSAFPHKEIATGYVGLSSLPQSSFPPPAYGTLRRKSDPDL